LCTEKKVHSGEKWEWKRKKDQKGVKKKKGGEEKMMVGKPRNAR
jgi:hypothetical protein